MKKRLIHGSMLAAAAFSLMVGGIAGPASVKDEVSNSSAIISKAIENSVDDVKSPNKGTVVKDVAAVSEDDKSVVTETTDAVDVQAQEVLEIETKKAKVESDQVVANIDSYLNIRSDADEESDVVGKFYNGNVGTIVEKGDQWSLVSSGNAYGYVNNDFLLFGSDAESYIENNCDQIAKVTAETLNIRAEESTDSEVVSLKDEGDALTVLGQDNGWYKVAITDDQSGYVSGDFVYIDYVYETAVTIEEERAAEEAAAEELARQELDQETDSTDDQTYDQDTEQNVDQNTYDTQQTETSNQEQTVETYNDTSNETVDSTDVVLTDESTSTETVKQETSGGSGQAVADYAVQFVGNPYVYGGTSLTNGADCSGFVQSVYKHFGYSLSRTAASQAGDGKAVSISDLQPGDLLFYHGFGHVAIYIGGGQVVHASNPSSGIKISNYDYSSIDKAVRIIY